MITRLWLWTSAATVWVVVIVIERVVHLNGQRRVAVRCLPREVRARFKRLRAVIRTRAWDHCQWHAVTFLTGAVATAALIMYIDAEARRGADAVVCTAVVGVAEGGGAA